MSSKTQIQNYALTLIGVTRINDENELSEEAVRVKSTYDIVYRSLLSQATWNFALKEVQLARVAGVTSAGYQNIYQLPNDCFKIVHVFGVRDYKSIAGKLHTNDVRVKIKYISDSIDTSAWSPQFTQAVAVTLASELAYAFTKSDSRTQTLQAQAARAVAVAKAHDSAEDIPDMVADWDNPLISVRRIG